MADHNDLVARIERLERRNRILTLLFGASLGFPLLAVLGWQATTPIQDVVRAKRIEVMDDKGVPVVQLGVERSGDGGSITLRDKLGERRSWWQVGPGTAAFTLNSANEDSTESGNSTLGLSVDPKNSKLALIGPGGSLLTAGIGEDQPRIELWSVKGLNLFQVPFKRAKG